MNNLRKTLIWTGVLSLAVISLVLYTQIYGQSSISVTCSYLDPIWIDLLAFAAGLFFIIEGLARVFEHPSASVKRQLTRIIRIAFGFGLLALHIFQFVHK